ncbi:MAG: pyridoxal phosphate-dependent aminotransferase [Clostridiales bacterium]|jgi:cystathionine beta-lyase|nr:pyridoxal phosphate-dependent aminotransferase [Clostridiales bacterium]
MSKYGFDTVIDRRGTNSLKYDFARERGKPDGLLPMWVADMDFAAPPEVLEELRKTVNFGVFGYSEVKADYYTAAANWFLSRFGFGFGPADVVKTPGVVFALALAVKAYTLPGDAVLIQTPVYYPFFEVIQNNGRKVAANPLVYKDGAYSIDFDDFERKIIESGARLFILCSPHNPVGRVWTRAELEQIRTVCKNRGVTVVSDEIHCDFVYPGHTHTAYGTLDPDAVICTSPSKTFNLAGLQTANIIIKNAALRKKFKAELAASGYSQLNAPGLAATERAYTDGAGWLKELLAYLGGNVAFAREFLTARLPRVRLAPTEGTYLLWLDFSAYGLTQAELDAKIIRGARLWLDSGTIFGIDGAGFQRMNIACPRAILADALNRLAAGVGN